MTAADPAFDELSFLILEDEMIIAMALETALQDAGASEVQLAMTLSEAEALAAERAFDAAILDLRLPDGDATGLGTELVARRVAVVIHSGHADLGHVGAIPGSVHCPKPATRHDIVGAIKRALASSVQDKTKALN
jgi:DNA-binding NtrC family response regulator